MSITQLDAGEKLAPANGLHLCYQTFGSPADPALVLVMGLGAQMVLWEDGFCRMLAERGFHVIRFDNRDIGKSSRISAPPPDLARVFAGQEMLRAPYTLADMAADTIGLMDALGLPQAHVVGASMGGMIAQEMAIRHPERVSTLTSIMSTTGERGLPPPKPEVWAAMVAPPPLTVEAFIEANVRVARLLRGYDDAAEEANDRARSARAAARGLNPAGGARQMAAIIASGSRAEALGEVKIPTLVIHGADDPLVPVEGGQATARAIPGAKLKVLEKMGHTLPRAVWPPIVEAIAAHARG
ncbi:MAG: alpha/beta fold hydrolase [Pseudomonadota bacterium]|nr:alpha/beta fold hydrolase [Pseudomonadota bacterium]